MKRILSIVLSATMLFAIPAFPAFAVEGSAAGQDMTTEEYELTPLEEEEVVAEPTAGGVYVVDDYITNMSNPTAVRDGINKALVLAGQNGTKAAPATVKFTSGKTYTINQILFCYSNTKIVATGATIKASGYEGSIIKGAHTTNGAVPATNQNNRCKAEEGSAVAGCNHGGYNQAQNVTITGGTWVASSSGKPAVNAQGIQFRHANNITFDGMTVQGNTNHAMNLSGSQNITVKNCTFSGALKYTGKDTSIADTDSLEAIHLDFCNKEGEPNVRPMDGTPCKNVVVEKCTFKGASGVGCHQEAGAGSAGKSASITIRNNTFTNLGFGSERGNAINYLSVSGLTITGNTANGVNDFANLKKDASGVTISNNTVTNLYGHGLQLVRNISGTVSGNKFTFAANPKKTANGITIRNSSNITSKSNTVTNSPQIGIMVDTNAKIVSTGDKVTGSKSNGIQLVKAAAGSTISGATVTNSAGIGISLIDVTSVAVKNSTVEASGKNGIQLVASSLKSVSAVIQGNHSVKNKGAKDFYIDAKANQGTMTSFKNNCCGAGSSISRIYNGTKYKLDASNGICAKHKGTTPAKLKIDSITAAKHEIGKVTFTWSKKSGTAGNWTIRYRWRKIGGNNSWTKWTTKTFAAGTMTTVINVPRNYCIEICGKGSGDSDWSKSIFTTPAGGAYQSMKYVHVKNVATNKRVTAITLKKGQTVKLRPDYDYPVKDYVKRPRLYPNHMFYDDANTSIISIRNDRTGKAYNGVMVDGTVTVKGLKAGTTTITCRAPNGRIMKLKVTVK